MGSTGTTTPDPELESLTVEENALESNLTETNKQLNDSETDLVQTEEAETLLTNITEKINVIVADNTRFSRSDVEEDSEISCLEFREEVTVFSKITFVDLDTGEQTSYLAKAKLIQTKSGKC